MYQLVKSPITAQINTVKNQMNEICFYIPFESANTDYQEFKTNVLNGDELQDADGNLMTAEEAKAFVATLP